MSILHTFVVLFCPSTIPFHQPDNDEEHTNRFFSIVHISTIACANLTILVIGHICINQSKSCNLLLATMPVAIVKLIVNLSGILNNNLYILDFVSR